MCKICHYVGMHHPRCPYYEPPKTEYYCAVCGDGIYEGDEYIENVDGEYMHYDCAPGLYDLLSWLGCDVKEMHFDH